MNESLMKRISNPLGVTMENTMSNTTISSCVLSLLMKGTMPYKEIALEVRKVFPDAQTTHKSVASLARDFRKAGKLPRVLSAAEPASEEPIDDGQLSMLPILEATEFQPTLI